MDFVDMGKRIKQKRMAKGMTQEELAEKSDLSAVYIGMLERGKRTPSLDTFVLIADLLEVTADELLCGTLKKGCQIRLAAYEEKLAGLSSEELKRFYNIMDAVLGIEQQ